MRKTMTLAVASHAGRVPADGTLSADHATVVLAALAQPTRLAIFKLLLKREPNGVAAGAIADTIGAPHNTISTHLAITGARRLAAQHARRPHHHLSRRYRGHARADRVSGQRLLRRPSGNV